MDPFSISAASLGFGIGSSIFGGALGLARMGSESAETNEQIRRFMRYRNRTMSEATAEGAASGITPDSASLTKYLADMSGEFDKQADWIKRAGDFNSEATGFSTLFDTLNNFGGSLTRFGKSNNWFQSPTL